MDRGDRWRPRTIDPRVIERISTSDGLETVLFVDDDHVIVGTEHGHVEIDATTP
jgi:hypothetical protein